MSADNRRYDNAGNEFIPTGVPTDSERWAIHQYELARMALNGALTDLRVAGELCQRERVYWNGQDCRWMRVPDGRPNEALDIEAFDRPRGYAEPVRPTDSGEAS